MGGALLQLVALGSQDNYLVGNPKISFFKSVYKHHTNFAIESKAQIFKENVTFGKKISCTIERSGDLISKMMLEIKLPAIGTSSNISWINSIGHHIIEYIEIEIGGLVIDKHYGSWMEIYSEFCIPESLQLGYYKMIGKTDVFTNVSQKNSMKLYIPLQFWFCKNIGNALPLIALQYHDVKINLKLRDFSECWYSGSSDGVMGSNVPNELQISSCQLFTDYVFLDMDERRKFAQSSHEYLIEQLQVNILNNVSEKKKLENVCLTFNHPIKELYWTLQLNSINKINDWNNFSNTVKDDSYSTDQEESLKSVVLSINGQERFQERDAEYFRLVQPFYHHSRVPKSFIYSYSFSINPESTQPSGSLNFSRIDNAHLTLKCVDNIKASNVNVYAINYNILKIMSGMGGLLFSN